MFNTSRSTLFHTLEISEAIELPKKFTFPFYNQPHVLSIKAAEEVQSYLEKQTDFIHNFGLDSKLKGLQIGKMFGVMIVKNSENEIGYLAAFSGKIAEQNFLKGFVPPIYDTLQAEGFYKKSEAQLNKLNQEIETLENTTNLTEAQLHLDTTYIQYENDLKTFKLKAKQEKANRQQQRENSKLNLSEDAYKELDDALSKQSIYYHFRLRDLKKEGEAAINKAKEAFETLQKPIEDLKETRKTLSASLQKRLHEQYRFLNAERKTKDLLDIFKNTNTPKPPAGSGECAAPKLFQYAYQNSLKPIAMAEFWYGVSPKSEVRQHKQYYPSCRGKCEPILGHMMQGLVVDENPMQQYETYTETLEIVYEDEYLLLVNKPHEFLSVPGKTIKDSVQERMKTYLPEAKGPLLVHRLDMSTSGLLLVAKNEKTHKNLQKQFIARTIKKRYVALLEGELSEKEGTIDLPLRVDLNNRPRQLVCYDHGKLAKTKFEVVAVNDGKTRVHFYPISGRTHQLRVHAAHVKGLQTPIVGDDLYGTKADRLYLHAEQLIFEHPVKKEMMEFVCKAPF